MKAKSTEELIALLSQPRPRDEKWAVPAGVAIYRATVLLVIAQTVTQTVYDLCRRGLPIGVTVDEKLQTRATMGTNDIEFGADDKSPSKVRVYRKGFPYSIVPTQFDRADPPEEFDKLKAWADELVATEMSLFDHVR